MTSTPKSLSDLGTFWSQHGGQMLGIVGDGRHCSGYHLGRDRIYSLCACRPDGTCEPGRYDNDYSVKQPRDKAGLTNAASAIDLGKLGTYAGLYQFSRWLVAQCQAEAPGSRDIREVIYSPDGMKVQRYSGVDGEIHTGPGNGDLSHRFHTHISYFRDSEKRDKRPLFAPYFELPDTSTPPEDDVIKPGDDFNGGWERWTLDGAHTVYSIGGPRLDDGTTDSTMRLCFNGDPTKPLFTVVDRNRLTNGKAVAASHDLFAVIAAGALPSTDCSDAIAVAREKDREAVLAKVAEVYP